MRKVWVITVALIVALMGATALILFVPNSLGKAIISEAKATGYIDYTPEEAIALAYERCSTCHTEQKMLRYCSRCGPPFIVVVHFMKKYTEITNAEVVAIAQAWNALIGNWESDWPEKDLRKLLDKDKALIDLLATPAAQRPIEAALKGKHASGSYRRYGLGLDDKE
jgi:hypothetical protein